MTIFLVCPYKPGDTFTTIFGKVAWPSGFSKGGIFIQRPEFGQRPRPRKRDFKGVIMGRRLKLFSQQQQVCMSKNVSFWKGHLNALGLGGLSKPFLTLKYFWHMQKLQHVLGHKTSGEGLWHFCPEKVFLRGLFLFCHGENFSFAFWPTGSGFLGGLSIFYAWHDQRKTLEQSV